MGKGLFFLNQGEIIHNPGKNRTEREYEGLLTIKVRECDRAGMADSFVQVQLRITGIQDCSDELIPRERNCSRDLCQSQARWTRDIREALFFARKIF